MQARQSPPSPRNPDGGDAPEVGAVLPDRANGTDEGEGAWFHGLTPVASICRPSCWGI